jgi:hypothetical protein|tara:strand:- start:8536 stop:9942 length:1407 start_codon:yes stop_codon:yes gene_type:complete
MEDITYPTNQLPSSLTTDHESNIWPIFERIVATNSTKVKQEILEEYRDETLLSRILYYAYNPHLNYYITGDALTDPASYEGKGISKALDPHDTILEDLISRKVTGHDARDRCDAVLAKLNYHDAIIFKRILNRDLRLGMGIKTINKVWKGLIPEFGVMLCSPANEKTLDKMDYPCLAQLKLDGMRSVVIVNNDSVQVKSRSGKDIQLHGEFDEQFSKLAQGGSWVFDGELLVLGDDGNPLDRKTGNGILNKAVKGTITPEDAKRVRMIVWDMIRGDGFAKGWDDRFNYNLRFKSLHQYLTGFTQGWIAGMAQCGENIQPKMQLVVTRQVANYEEANEWAQEVMAQGHEGIILKSTAGLYENKRVNHQIKIKAELEADLVVTDWIEGTGRNEGRLGALTVESADGGVKVNVGSGFSDELRDEITKDSILGSIITVRYNEIIQDKNSSTKSLFLPRFLEVRLDKDTADIL